MSTPEPGFLPPSDTPSEPGPSSTGESNVRRGTWRRFLLEMLLIAAVVAGVSIWRGQTMVPRGLDVSELSVMTLEGQVQPLGDVLNGRRTMVYTWATWCTVCHYSHDSVGLSRRLFGGGEGQQIVSLVAADVPVSRIRAAIADDGLSFPVYLASDETLETLGVGAFPTTIFVGSTGDVRTTMVGWLSPVGAWLGLQIARF